MVKEIGVCILFFEKLDQTLECIESVLNSGCNIYVYDNGSSVDSRRKLLDWCKEYSEVKVFRSRKNDGPSVGRNFLIRETIEPWLLFLDNDIYIQSKDWYNILHKHIEVYKDVDALVPRLFNVHEQSWVRFHSFRLKGKTIEGVFNNEEFVNCFPGGAALVNRKMFNRIGCYNSDLRVLEDYELAIRALIKYDGIRAKLIHDVKLIHHHRYVKNNKDKSAVMIRYKKSHYEKAEEFIRKDYDIEFYSGWYGWVSEQLNGMIHLSKRMQYMRKLSLKLNHFIGRIKRLRRKNRILF